MESICKNTLAKLEKDIDKLREDRNQYFIKHPQETDKDRNEEICRRAEIIYKVRSHSLIIIMSVYQGV